MDIRIWNDRIYENNYALTTTTDLTNLKLTQYDTQGNFIKDTTFGGGSGGGLNYWGKTITTNNSLVNFPYNTPNMATNAQQVVVDLSELTAPPERVFLTIAASYDYYSSNIQYYTLTFGGNLVGSNVRASINVKSVKYPNTCNGMEIDFIFDIYKQDANLIVTPFWLNAKAAFGQLGSASGLDILTANTNWDNSYLCNCDIHIQSVAALY